MESGRDASSSRRETPVARTLGELAALVRGVVKGDAEMVITGVAGVREARPGDITFAADARYVRRLADSKASAAVVSGEIILARAIPVILVADPEEAFSKIAACFAPPPVRCEPGVHPSAVVAPDVRLGKNVAVGACVVVESGSSIGDGTTLWPQVYVGRDVAVGANCVIYPNVTLRERVRIGDRCIIHSGSVIGSDGFGYVQREGRHEKVPQLGTVVIEDDVELGACVTVDRARFARTWIKKGTKIDNLVQIGHNVVLGENCIIVSMVGLCGSVHVGNNVVLAGRVSVDSHLSIGDGAMVGALSGVTKDVPDGMFVSGYPAQEHKGDLRLAANLQRVPKLLERVKELEKKVRELGHVADHDR
jgi:UDP-3-O-[3-hydroxymyristoyl] glucosamine N-acyltransferase